MSSFFRPLLIALLLGVVISACGSQTGSNAVPSITAESTQHALPTPSKIGETQLVAPTITPSPTRAARPTRTPYPTPDPSDGTEEVPEDYVLPGEWLYTPFTDTNGMERTLEDFIGRGVIVQIVSTTCDLCLEQHRYLLAAIQDRYDLGLLPDTAFIALSVEQQETPRLIQAVFQNELADAWSTVETLEDPGVSADWLAAVASPELVDALVQTFGPHIKTASELTTIIIQPDGLAHQLTGTLASPSIFRDAISAYGNPPIR